MKSSKHVFSGLVIVVAAAVLVLASCKITSAPSTAEVIQAYNAMTAAGSDTTPDKTTWTKTGAYWNGSATFVNTYGGHAIAYSSSNDADPVIPPPNMGCTMSGSNTFYNWYDAATGYVINGTMSMTETTDGPMSATPLTIALDVIANLTLSGGPISTISCNIVEDIYYPLSGPAVYTVSGTVTADGFDFNVTQLSAAGAKALMISGPASKKTN